MPTGNEDFEATSERLAQMPRIGVAQVLDNPALFLKMSLNLGYSP